jgi:FMN phosphatase YigB (HAD superfamily)
VFFDIGGTLGTVDVGTKTLTPFPEMIDLLKIVVKVLRLPTGVITNIPEDWTTDDVEKMLIAAEILGLLDRRGVITSAKAGASKPNPGIYEFAASQLGVQTSECLFIDDAARYVLGACGAGMSAIQKAAPEEPGAS